MATAGKDQRLEEQTIDGTFTLVPDAQEETDPETGEIGGNSTVPTDEEKALWAEQETEDAANQQKQAAARRSRSSVIE
jgi:hypothetical protein